MTLAGAVMWMTAPAGYGCVTRLDISLSSKVTAP
jgi:hypothetical protein